MAKSRKRPDKSSADKISDADSPAKPAKRKASESFSDEAVQKKTKKELDSFDSASKASDCYSDEAIDELECKPSNPATRTKKKSTYSPSKKSVDKLIGKPVPDPEARQKWPHRYEKKILEKGENEVLLALCHYTQAMVDGVVYNLYDNVYVKAEDNEPNFIAKIVELFEASDKKPYFTAQWYFKHVDTVIQERVVQELKDLFDDRRVFYSDIRDENPLDCIVSKLKIVHVAPGIHPSEIPTSDIFCDMTYSLRYSTISNLPTASSEGNCNVTSSDLKNKFAESRSVRKAQNPKMKLLDLYSGCGAMSTGLCLGAALSGVHLVTRWAVDMNEHACDSLRFNHPETEVRNESADDFLSLLKKWGELCREFCLLGDQSSTIQCAEEDSEPDGDFDDDCAVPSGEFEVGKLIGICFGDPNKCGEKGVYFKVQWKNYDSSNDSWEPIDILCQCQEKIREFVTEGYKSNMLPLPGDVDIICGGPPCQGVSGFNRFRNKQSPLNDPKNSQLIVFMDIVDYLKPRYVLMENVTDLLKFVDGYLGRYAIGRLVAMNYQTRLGLMAAGSYGLPQFRMRAFFWGAYHTEKLPPFPLSTHEVLGRGSVPGNFESNLVPYDKDRNGILRPALRLQDAISDFPKIQNDEIRDEMPYDGAAITEFQNHIRSNSAMLYDHRPLKLNTDDYLRVCRIPKKKGASFRDLPGVLVDIDNKVYMDPKVKRELLPSGKPLVPDYAITFVKGKSSKPFRRLWGDEIVPTVVTRAEPHNQAILHPNQDRVLSIRENARIQGFPDKYKLFGPVKERYTQVGNAVAVPVSRALGYALGLACQGLCNDEPLLTLPPDFPNGLPHSS